MAEKKGRRLEELSEDDILELHHWILNKGGITGEILTNRFLVAPSVLDEKTVAEMQKKVGEAAKKAAGRKARAELGLSPVEPIPSSKKKFYKKLTEKHLEG